MYLKHFLFTITVAIGIQLCPQETSAQSAKYYKSFFVGEKGMQYFIKPIKFKNKEIKNESLTLDFTFRTLDSTEYGVNINFSLFSNQPYKYFDKIIISNNSTSIELTNTTLLYNARKGKNVETRISGKCSHKDILALFSDPQWIIHFVKDEKQKVFYTPQKAQKKVESLNQNVLLFL